MNIDFHVVRSKNFMSIGNDFCEVRLDSVAKTLIVGKNGNGKSCVLLDAICFGLFGKPFRDVKKDNIVNAVNKKQCVVEVEFTIGTNNFLVRRGISPNIFEIYQNNDLLKQNASVRDYQAVLEKYVLGMDLKTFKQTIVLGAANYHPFMQLTAMERRDVVENLLSLRVFSVMMASIKDELSALRKDESAVDAKLTASKGFYQTQKDLLIRMQNSTADADAQIQLKIDAKNKVLDAKITELRNVSSKLSESKSIVKPDDFFSSISDTRSQLSVLDTKIGADRSQVRFFQHHDHCPTCLQGISYAFKASKMADLTDSIGKYNEQKKRLELALDDLTAKKHANDNARFECQQIEHQVESLKSYVRQISAEVKLMESTMGKAPQSDQEVVASIRKLADQIKKLAGEKEALLVKIEADAIIASMLNDTGIKSRIIDLYVPMLNTFINQYLSDLGFFVQFTINNKFEECIKSRFRDEFEYNNFSQGEKLRIDLSILFAWREVSKRKNSVSSNLLIMDEIMDGSIDDEGAQDFMRLLNKMEKTNIFIISHRSELISDKFDRVLKVTKPGNYTVMEEDRT